MAMRLKCQQAGQFGHRANQVGVRARQQLLARMRALRDANVQAAACLASFFQVYRRVADFGHFKRIGDAGTGHEVLDHVGKRPAARDFIAGDARVKQPVSFPAEAVRSVAKAKKVPLIDYHAEILKRRPDDWDGSLPKFKDVKGSEYEVPTLIARDGGHPSNPQAFKDYSAKSLSSNGYALRNYLTLLAYADVVRQVLPKK